MAVVEGVCNRLSVGPRRKVSALRIVISIHLEEEFVVLVISLGARLAFRVEASQATRVLAKTSRL
jgi:hypothetical protein